MTQAEKIYNYFKSGKHLTSWSAIHLFGITRLAEIVRQVSKKYGVEVKRKNRNVINRDGHSVVITEYWIDNE